MSTKPFDDLVDQFFRAGPPPEDQAQAKKAIRDAEQVDERPAEVRMHEDKTRENRTPGFTRMRTRWGGIEGAHVASLTRVVDQIILESFPGAIMIMNDLFEIVREPQVTPDGEVVTDSHGLTMWVKNESGAYVEDYSRLTHRDREDFLFRITTNLVQWQERRADLWGEAMFAKAVWEERFADGFLGTPGMRPTVDDKTNRARSRALDERYFAIFKALVSRRADALVESMVLLGQRLKDVME